MSRLVVVSNRVPVAAAGAKAGGLAVALRGLMEQRGGLWFGWSGDIAEDGIVHQVRTTESGNVEYATIDLTRDEHERYYTGFSNTTLWPLLHSLLEHMSYERRNLLTYRLVNQRMADALQPLLRPTDTVWVHDYHLMPMPAALRAGGFKGPIGFFLHVPFPSPDILSSVPEGSTLVRDLLASDLIGFQTTNDVDNFTAAAARYAGATRVPGSMLLYGGRKIRLGAFPVEIDFDEFRIMAEDGYRSPETERLRRSLQGQTLIFGAERMDPTKGLPQRLAGFRRLLETRPAWRRRTTLLQIAASSRTEVESYRALREELERQSGAINSEWSEPDWVPVRLLARGGAREAIAGYMREARVGLVTPLRDGMNLVAKEYVAAQDPQDPGVLILSRFAGAARQLGAALLVNPYDADEMADALDTALNMTRVERQDRWKMLSKALGHTSTLNWGRSFVSSLTRVSEETAPPAEPERAVLHAAQ
jgi:trehalose 6-phosphate synthase